MVRTKDVNLCKNLKMFMNVYIDSLLLSEIKKLKLQKRSRRCIFIEQFFGSRKAMKQF